MENICREIANEFGGQTVAYKDTNGRLVLSGKNVFAVLENENGHDSIVTILPASFKKKRWQMIGTGTLNVPSVGTPAGPTPFSPLTANNAGRVGVNRKGNNQSAHLNYEGS